MTKKKEEPTTSLPKGRMIWAGITCAFVALGCSSDPGKKDALRQKDQNLGYSATDWLSKGPSPIVDPNNVSLPFAYGGPATGAVERLLLDPSNSTGVYAASVNGGVWKNQDYTVSLTPPNLAQWQTTMDGLPSLSMGGLALDPTNPQHLVAGTGCHSSAGWDLCGVDGLIYESSSGADGWLLIGSIGNQPVQAMTVRGQNILVASGHPFAPGSIYRRSTSGGVFVDIQAQQGLPPGDFGPVYDLVADPTNSSRYYAVAGNRGGNGAVYRSVDDGQTWIPVSDSSLTSVLNQSATNARLAIGPTGRLFVVVATVGEASAISYTDDQGQTWQSMDVPSFPSKASLASGALAIANVIRAAGTSDIIVTTAAPHQLLATNFVRLANVPLFDGVDLNGDWRVVIGQDSLGNSLSAFQFSLVDRFSGAMGTTATSAASVSGGSSYGWEGCNNVAQANIHLALTVDPGNPDIVYIAGDASPIQVARGLVTATKGAMPSQQWASLTWGAAGVATISGSGPHADVRDLVVDDAGRLLAATDGGVFINSSPQNAMGDWYSVAGDMVTAEMMTIAIDPLSGALIGGLQDNGSPASDDPTGAPAGQAWFHLSYADGRGVAAVDSGRTTIAGDPYSFRYATCQSSDCFRRFYRDVNGNVVPADLDGDLQPDDNTQVPLKYDTARTVPIPNTTPPATRPFAIYDVVDTAWMETLVTNQYAPDRLLIGARAPLPGALDKNGNPMVGGVWESLDRGVNIDPIPNAGADIPISATSIDAGAPGNPDALWVAAPSGLYSRMVAGGALARVSNFPIGQTPLAVVMASHDPQTVYVTTAQDRVFTNLGGTWLDITGDLDNVANYVSGMLVTGKPQRYRDIEYVPSSASDRVIISAAKGTMGAYMMALDQPGVWMRIGYGDRPFQIIPYSPVFALDYDVANDTLAVATTGRGAWTVTGISQLNRAPIAQCKTNHTEPANIDCEAYLSGFQFDDGSVDSDSSDPVSFGIYLGPGLVNGSWGPYPLGPSQVIVQVSDNEGASSLCEPVALVVVDLSPPAINAPPDVEIASCNGIEFVELGEPTVTENCTQNLTVTGHIVSKNGVPLSPPIEVFGGQVNLGPGEYEIAWAADDGANPAVTDVQHVSVVGLIQAGNTYFVRDNAKVEDINGNPAAVLNSGSGQTTIGGNTATVGAIIAGGNVDVAWQGYVYGDITAVGNINVSDPSLHFGNEVSVSGTGLPALPTIPAFPPITDGSFDVNPGNAPSPLAPGSYDRVAVNGNLNNPAVLTFGPGDFYIRDLYLNADGVTVVADPNTRLFVSRDINYHNRFRMAADSEELAPVYLAVAGTGQLGMYAPFEGTLVAPQRQVSFGTGSGLTFRGSFYAASIEVTPGSKLVCDAVISAGIPDTCSDEAVNFDETDEDCGGPVCQACPDGLACDVASDCVSEVCEVGICQVPDCSDGIQNGLETGMDCGGACPACPVPCTPQAYQAENMYHSIGNAWWQGGWNIYSNGYISTSHNFSSGPSVITIRAQGQQAAGLPHMTVSVGGVVAAPQAGVNVAAGGWNSYPFTFNAAGGPQEVRVIFDNDYNGPAGDRNLLVDDVSINCP